MEASERHQLDLAVDPAGTVRAIGDRLVIESLTLTDERAARVVRERAEAGEEPAHTVTTAIEIGTRILERENLSAEVDYVRAEFERVSAVAREQLTERARDLGEMLESGLQRVFSEDDGVLNASLETHAEQLAEQFANTFDPERQSAVQHQVKELVARSMLESRESLIRHLSSEDGSNPLADFKAGVQRYVTDLSRRSDANAKVLAERLGTLEQSMVRLTEQAESRRALAAAEEAGTRKGRDFEETVHAMIESIAAGQGDAAHHTGDASTESGAKKGDSVVEVGGATGPAAARIVFEAKNKKLGKTDAWLELNAAMAERDAAFGVLVVAGEDKLPSGLEEITEYQGNKMIVVVDREDPDPTALKLAYRYVRARVLASGAGGLEVDAAGVRDAAEEALAHLKRANRIRKSLTSITKGADSARGELDEMIAELERCLTRIDALVAIAAAESQAD